MRDKEDWMATIRDKASGFTKLKKGEKGEKVCVCVCVCACVCVRMCVVCVHMHVCMEREGESEGEKEGGRGREEGEISCCKIFPKISQYSIY